MVSKIYDCYGNADIHLDVLKAICGNTENESMIDLCCGFCPQTRQLRFTDEMYVDVVQRDLAERGNRFMIADVFDFIKILFPVRKGTSFLLDALEHFQKEKSLTILKWMEQNTHRQVIFTPLGDYVIETTPTNNPDSHKSGWQPEELNKIGYATIVFPNFHQTLNVGAFFSFKHVNLEQEFNRVITELNRLKWAK